MTAHADVIADLDSPRPGPYDELACDPVLVDTAQFCEAYGIAPEESANAILVASKKPEGRQRGLCRARPHSAGRQRHRSAKARRSQAEFRSGRDDQKRVDRPGDRRRHDLRTAQWTCGVARSPNPRLRSDRRRRRDAVRRRSVSIRRNWLTSTATSSWTTWPRFPRTEGIVPWLARQPGRSCCRRRHRRIDPRRSGAGRRRSPTRSSCSPVAWSSSFTADDVVLIRSPYDYVERPAEFRKWLDDLDERVGYGAEFDVAAAVEHAQGGSYATGARGVARAPTEMLTQGSTRSPIY